MLRPVQHHNRIKLYGPTGCSPIRLKTYLIFTWFPSNVGSWRSRKPVCSVGHHLWAQEMPNTLSRLSFRVLLIFAQEGKTQQFALVEYFSRKQRTTLTRFQSSTSPIKVALLNMIDVSNIIMHWACCLQWHCHSLRTIRTCTWPYNIAMIWIIRRLFTSLFMLSDCEC